MTQLQTLKTVSKAISEAPCMAFIAGGAPRDIDNGKPYKDIDIFALYEEENDVDNIVRWFSTQIECTRYFERVPEGNQYEQNFNGIHSVHNLYHDGNDGVYGWATPLQLILQKYNPDLDPIRQVVDRFDLNTSQITMIYNPENERYIISKTQGYNGDKLARVTRLTEHGQRATQEQRSRSYQRARRISMKLGFANAVPQYTVEEMQQRRYDAQQRAIAPGQIYWSPQLWNVPLATNNWPTRAG